MSNGMNRRAMHDALAKRFSPTAVYNAAANTQTAAAAQKPGVDNIAAGPGAANPATTAAAVETPAADRGHGADGANGGADGGDGGLAGFFSSFFDPEPTTSPTIVVKTSATPVTPVKPTTSSSVVTSVTKLTTSSSSVVTQSSSSVVTISSPAVRSTHTITGSQAVETFVTKITSSQSSHSASNTLSTADAAAASSPAATPSSMSKGTLVGGIAAAIVVALVAIIGAFYFVRKCRSRQDEEEDAFDPNAFRNQSIALPDDTPSPMARVPSRTGGASPRPPTMIERKYNNITVPRQPMYPGEGMYPGQNQYAQDPYAQNYGAFGQTNAYSDFSAQQQQQQMAPMPSFQPGQVIFSPETPTPRAMTFSPPPVPNMHAGAFNPIAPPQPVAFQDEIPGDLTRRSSNGSQTSLTRKNSQGSNHGNTPNPFEQASEAHYVDLNRSSVTPFQAAQYVEISRRLGSAPPTPLLEVSEEGQAAQHASPFDDENTAQEITLPAPTAALRAPRIASTPPMLPEVSIQRPFSPVVISPGPTTGFGSPSAPAHLRVSTAPSFDINAPKIDDFDLPPSAAPNATGFNTARTSVDKKPATRPETIYDDEDAYGGM